MFLRYETKMLQTPKAHEKFVETVTEWINKDFAHYLPETQRDNGFYIPTFVVVRLDKSTTKFRLILNGKHAFSDGLCILFELFN